MLFIYDEKDPFETEEDGDPQGEGVNTGVIGEGISAAAAAEAYASAASVTHHDQMRGETLSTTTHSFI